MHKKFPQAIKSWIFILFAAIPFFMTAQNQNAPYSVKGQAIDSTTSESIPYVTCSILSATNPQLVATRFASDDDGNFSGHIKTPGKYVLVITYVGKQTAKKSFSIDASNKSVDLGKVLLADSKSTLQEVSVVASKPLIKADADKITYDAEQDPDSKSTTLLDLLRKVPMVTVDGQDNVQLKGSSNFKYFLNGKPTNMFNSNAGTILKSMPANMVKNIEVITQPGAKYDAEGVGGIINIVTVKQSSTEGYSATINGQLTSRKSRGAGINLMVQKGKFSFSGNYNYNYNRQFPLTTTTERHSQVENTPYPYARQKATLDQPVPMQFGSGQLSYELDTLNLFTASFNRSFGRPNKKTEALTEDFSDDEGLNKVFEYTQSSKQKESWGSTDFGIDYQHSFKKKGESLTLSYKLSNTPNNSNYEATNTINSDYVDSPQSGLAAWSKSENKASTNEHTFQADYANPIAKDHTLEFGTKYIIRLNDSKSNESYQYFDFDNAYPYTPYVDSDTTTNFKNDLDILGAYASYRGNKGMWSWTGGLRYEYTWLNAKFNVADMNFNTNYGILAPSVNLTYKISQMESFKLGYNMRIQRPSISYLNPYVDSQDPNYITYGNPHLDPEKSHNITLVYSKFAQKINLNSELTYTFINNSIQQYSFINSETSVQEITYDNIGHNKQLNLNLFGSYRPTNWLNIYTNTNIGYVSLKSNGTTSFSNQGFTGKLYLGGTGTLPKDMRVSAGAGGNLPQVNLQGKQSSFFFSYAALSKDFMKKKLTVSMSAVYLPKSHIIIDTKGSNFTQRTDVHLTQTAEFRLNISYRIGDITAKVKKAKATINNDDQKEKSNSNMGQSPM